jgi:GT2 family glycosyltransferase
VLALEDLVFVLFGKHKPTADSAPRCHAASIVIPNWNGRELLEQCLPSVIAAACRNPEHEVIVVDNASTDGSVDLLREKFPSVRIMTLDRNLGFAGACNQGVLAARHDIVVLLNNDMRVEPDFLEPLLEPFSDPLVFAVSSQIFFADPAKRREETGLTQTWWQAGRLYVSHRIDPSVTVPYPCAYPGGGSSAFDRRKFLELGGFDHLFEPFYYEDTDLGHLAWKRGWKVLYQPRSIVYHQHRATIARTYPSSFIENVLEKNRILFAWKNIHDWKLLLSHFAVCSLSASTGRAFLQLPKAWISRWRAHSLRAVSDSEAFLRQHGGWFRDRFEAPMEPAPERLRVLFLAPYPIEPPVHGGAVFMRAAVRSLAALVDLHLIAFLEQPEQAAEHAELARRCASAQFFLRRIVPPRHPSTLLPHAIREFTDPEFAWAVNRTIYLKKIDAVQIDYTILGQYAAAYSYIPCFLFEHDIFFQALWRNMRAGRFTYAGIIEYLRMLRYELQLLRRVTGVQVCSRPGADYLLSYLPELSNRIRSDLRAVIEVSNYRFISGPREPKTMLFIGSFRHTPNLAGLVWFVERVLPRILAKEPKAKLVVIGSDPPRCLNRFQGRKEIEILGFVPDISHALACFSVFVCPVLSGSGIRVKLLEAFASGIPVVSTRVGAEGFPAISGEVCELADSPEAFATSVLRLFSDPAYAAALAWRAREMVVRSHDARASISRLEAAYRAAVRRRRPALSPDERAASRSVVAYGEN